MKMTSNPILLLLLLGLLFYTVLFLALSQAKAGDCADKTVRCSPLISFKEVPVYGWQSTTRTRSKIWPHPKYCKRTGRKQCPRRPNLNDMPEKVRLATDVEGLCRAAVVADFKGRGEDDHCSTGIFGKAFPVAGQIFGKSACMEHDICYSMPGTRRRDCDRMFLTNLMAACKQYFVDHAGNRTGVVALNQKGYRNCVNTARAGHAGVLAVGGAFFGPNDYPACKGTLPTPIK